MYLLLCLIWVNPSNTFLKSDVLFLTVHSLSLIYIHSHQGYNHTCNLGALVSKDSAFIVFPVLQLYTSLLLIFPISQYSYSLVWGATIMYTVYTNTRLQFGVYLQWYQIFSSAVYSTYLHTSILVYARAGSNKIIVVAYTCACVLECFMCDSTYISAQNRCKCVKAIG